MSNVSTPAAGYSLPTPSPFSLSVASTRLSSTSSLHLSNLLIRLFVLLLSFVSALSLAAPSAKKKKGEDHSSFDEYPELMYCFISTILAFVYSAYQLFKAVSDISYRGFLVSDRISDYSSFILDQLTGYLLISSSSVAVTAIQDVDPSKTLWKAAIISTCMSFSAFLVTFASGLLSGYKLCKRIIW